MDGASATAGFRSAFRTPVRILLPKLLRSRDAWKAKSHRRKAELRAASVKIRDLTASRAGWRQRAEQAERDCQELRQQRDESQEQLARARAQAAEPPVEKKV